MTRPSDVPTKLCIRDIAQRAGRIAMKKGFEPPSWTNFPIKVLGVVTEIEEAIEALAVGEATPVANELADTAIRTLDILETIWGKDWDAVRIDKRSRARKRLILSKEPRLLFEEHMKMIRFAVEAWRKQAGPQRGDDNVRGALECVVTDTLALADKLDIDLYAAMMRKCDYNEKRPMRNGKVQASF